MKKIILLICAMVLFPMITFAQVITQNDIDQAIELHTNYTYDWGSFAFGARQTEDKEGNWKYGYVKADDDYNYVPNKPKNFKVPDYLSQFPIVNDVDIDEYRSKDRTFIRFIRCYSPGREDDELVFGVTKNYEWIVVDNRENNMSGSSKFNNYFQPYEDARVSIMKTIRMRCEKEYRDPTIHEKYLILVLDQCKEELRALDTQYIETHQKEYAKAQRDQTIFHVLWTSRLVMWLLLILFVMALPGIIFAIVKLVFPKGSIFSSAVNVLDVILGLTIFAYIFGSKRK